jgi:hypothetical protein
MYNLREDLFERDEDESLIHYEVGDSLDSGSSQPSSHSTHVFHTIFASPSILEESDNEEIYFPSYDEPFHSVSKISNDNHAASLESSAELPITEMGFRPFKHSEDDIAACIKPSRHVDYLSHEWKEDEIASSWKYIVSKKNVHPNSKRLENASWRAWEKKRRNLRTVSPDAVKWLKDHDVTWLYGPLQPGISALDTKCSIEDNSQTTEEHSTRQTKKPCLKKRTVSELMLLRSISSASLRPALSTAEAHSNKRLDASTYSSSTLDNLALTRAHTMGVRPFKSSPIDSTSSVSSDSGIWTSKSVRFHKLVEQCIALEGLANPNKSEYDCISDSEDEVMLMRRTIMQQRMTRKRRPSIIAQKKFEAKTIEKLPPATLKAPMEVGEAYTSRGFGIPRAAAREVTLRPSQVTPLQFHNDEDSDIDDDDEYWKPPARIQNRRDSIQILHDKLDSIRMQSFPLGLTGDSSVLPRPGLERRHETRGNSPQLEHGRGSKVERRDRSTAFEQPPHRSELTFFSFTQPTPSMDSDEEEGAWSPFTIPNTWNPDPASSPVFNINSASRCFGEEEDPDSDAFKNFTSTAEGGWSPRTSSDEGYGSEERGEEWKVRDVSATASREEKERGVYWEMFDEIEAWDED